MPLASRTTVRRAALGVALSLAVAAPSLAQTAARPSRRTAVPQMPQIPRLPANPPLGDFVPLGDSGLRIRAVKDWQAYPHSTPDTDYCFMAPSGTSAMMFVTVLPEGTPATPDVADKAVAADRAKENHNPAMVNTAPAAVDPVDAGSPTLARWHVDFTINGQPNTITHYYRAVGGRVVDVQLNQTAVFPNPPFAANTRAGKKAAEAVLKSVEPADGSATTQPAADAGGAGDAPPADVNGAAAPSDVALVPYAPEGQSFSMSYPKGWDKPPPGGSQVLVMFGHLVPNPAGPGKKSAVTISVLRPGPTLPGATADDLARATGEAIKKQATGYVPVSEGPVTLADGWAGYETIGDVAMHAGDPATRNTVVVAVKDGKAYSLAFTADPALYDQYRPTFDAVLKTFTVP